MPAKMARSAPRPPFGPSEVTVAVRNSLLSCRKAGILPEGRKTANICPNLGVIRGIPVNVVPPRSIATGGHFRAFPGP